MTYRSTRGGSIIQIQFRTFLGSFASTKAGEFTYRPRATVGVFPAETVLTENHENIFNPNRAQEVSLEHRDPT
jgi:hypothetical protein